MKWRVILVLLLVILLAAWMSAAVEKSLSLQECLHIALKNNIALGIKVAQAERKQGLLQQAKEKFLPALNCALGKSKTNTPSASWIEAEDQISASSGALTAQLDQALWLGGQLTIGIDSSRYDSNERFQTINPSYNCTVAIKWVQPLLRDGGDRISRREIIIARNNRNISDNDLKTTLNETVCRIEELYWNLVYAERNLDVKKKSMQLAEDLLTKNRRMAELGLLAEIEILSAEAEVASRRAEILDAQALRDNTGDELRSLLNETDDSVIRPTDEPRSDEQTVDLEDCLNQALAYRPDFVSAAINLKSKELELDFAKNQLLPTLDLTAQYWSPGISGDRLIYKDNDPFGGEVIDIIPGGSSDALKDALDFRYRNWSVYLSLGIPLNSVFSHGAVHAARMDRREAELLRQDLERQIRLEVMTAARTVGSDFQRIHAYRTSRELAERRMTAEEKRLAVGMSTSFIVLQYQRDYAQALSSEVRALSDYNLALARLEKAKGTILQAKGIVFSEAIIEPAR